ncbi:MAG: fimbrial assembly protein [Rhodospirillales bacterium]|jgi:general secretion pathway protein L|nr:fimbrial assembly protein [Rhodospirillales bacterium]
MLRLEALRPFAPTLVDSWPKLQRMLRPAQDFLAWWTSELRACVPPRLRGVLSRPGQVVELVVADGAARFSRRRGAQSEDLARIGLARNEEVQARRALAQLRAQIQPKRAHIHLGIAPGQVLRRTIDLPVSVVENLREVLELELDRHTPFRPAEVYFDHRVAGFDDGGKRVLVEIAVVPRRLADRALSIARALGFPPERVGIAGEDGIDFLRAEGEAEAEGPSEGAVARLGVAAGLALLLLLPWMALKLTEQREEARAAELRQEAAETDALRKEIDTLIGRNRSLPLRKQNGPTLMAVLEELASILPDGTWVAELRLEGPKLSLVGYSQSASGLIAVIEQSDLFSASEFASPVMPDATLDAERFHLIATVGGK